MAPSKSKQSGHDVIVVEVQAELPGQIREALRPKGFPTHLVADLQAAKELADKTPSPVLMVAINRDLGVAETFFKELEKWDSLYQHPILVLGETAEALQEIVDRHFGIGYCLKLPTSSAEVIGALQHLTRSVRSGRLGPGPQREHGGESGVSIEPPKASSTPKSGSEHVISTPIAPPVVKRSSSDSASKDLKRNVPEELFSVIGNLGLFTRKVGGDAYPVQASDEELIRRAGLPTHYRGVTEEITAELGSSNARHLYRSAFIAWAVCSALKLPEKDCACVRDASLLLATNFSKQDRALLRKNYLSQESSNIKKEFGSRMKDSAMKVAIDLGAPDVGQVISAAARLLNGEIDRGSDRFYMQASAVVGSELIDRICYQSGSWNPRSAYYLMRKCKSNDFSDLHPSVLACLIKLLSEAIASCTLSILLNKKIRDNPALKAEAKRLKEEPVLAHESKINMQDLAPGMRLSRPIQAYDGRLILAEDLILDQDLIWRLWQLSSIRPLNSPVVILQPVDTTESPNHESGETSDEQGAAPAKMSTESAQN